MPATATITLHANLFTLPPLPLLTGCSGEPTIPQVHYSHNDVAVFARFCYWLGGVFRSYFMRTPVLDDLHALVEFARRVHSRYSRSSITDAFGDNPATPKAGSCVRFPRLPWSLGSEEQSDLERVVISPAVPLAFERHFRCCDESTAAVSRLLACLLYGRYSDRKSTRLNSSHT